MSEIEIVVTKNMLLNTEFCKLFNNLELMILHMYYLAQQEFVLGLKGWDKEQRYPYFEYFNEKYLIQFLQCWDDNSVKIMQYCATHLITGIEQKVSLNYDDFLIGWDSNLNKPLNMDKEFGDWKKGFE